MSCSRPVTAWRTPADVRPTLGFSVFSFVWAHFACCIDKCLRAATRPTGSCIRYKFPSPGAPSGCGSSALERSWSFLVVSSPWVCITKDTSLVLLVSDVAHAEGWRGLAFPMPKNSVRLETTTAGPVDALRGGRCRLVAEDVLPG